MSPLISLILMLAALVGFITFVFRWNAFYFYRLDPVIRQKVSDWLGIPITLQGRLNYRYHWVTSDPRQNKQWQLFGCNVIAAILFGLVPNFLAMLAVGLPLHALGVL